MTHEIKNQRMASLSAWSLATLFLGGCCLGVAPVVVKSIEFSPEVSAFYRVALSAPFFMISALLFAGRQSRKPQTQPRAKIPTNVLCLITAFFFATDLVVMHLAIRYSDVAVATLLTNCAPFFVGMMGVLGLTKRPDRRFWIMLPLALVGCALLVGAPQNGTTQVLGSVLSLVAAFLYASYVTCVTALRQRGVGTSKIMVSVTVVSTLFIFPLFAWHGFPLPQNGQTILLLVVLVVVGQILGQGLVTVALRDLPASLSSLVLLVQPVIAGVLSWYFLSEYLDPVQIAGIVIVLSAIAGATLVPAHLFASVFPSVRPDSLQAPTARKDLRDNPR